MAFQGGGQEPFAKEVKRIKKVVGSLHKAAYMDQLKIRHIVPAP